MRAEEEGARRAVVVAREIDHRSVLLPWLQLPAGSGFGYWLRRLLAGGCWGFCLVLGLWRRHGGWSVESKPRRAVGIWGTGALGRLVAFRIALPKKARKPTSKAYHHSFRKQSVVGAYKQIKIQK